MKDGSHAEQIMTHCLLVNDYTDLIETALEVNWKNHSAAEAISRDDFRRNLKLD